MKQIVRTAPKSQVVEISNFVADLKKYYGIDFGADRGFVVRDQYSNGSFSVLATEELTNKNCHWGYTLESIEKIAAFAIENNHSFFEFDSAKELFNWLSN